MMLRAFKAIAKGQELTISYRNPEDKSRTDYFKRENYECPCRLCVFEANESSHTQNKIQEELECIEKNLVKFHNLQGMVQNPVSFENVNEEGAATVTTGFLIQKVAREKETKVINEMVASFRKICELRRNHPGLNMALVTKKIIYNLGVELAKKELFKESLEIFEAVRAASYCALKINSSVLNLDSLITVSYLRLNDMEGVKKTIKVYKEDLVTAYGTVEAVKQICPILLTQLEDRNISFF